MFQRGPAAQELRRTRRVFEQYRADRIAGIAHRRKHEDAFDLGKRGDTLIEFHVGEHAAVQRHALLAALGNKISHQRGRDVFQPFLRRRRNVLAAVAFDRIAQVSVALRLRLVLADKIRSQA